MISVSQLFYNTLKSAASRIGNYMDYETYPTNETKLANLYLDAKNSGDADLAESYMAALILRHWKDASKLYDSTKTVAFALDKEDFITKVYERIEYACKYASWKTNSKLTAQQCINRSIATEVKNLYYFSNRDKYKANANTISMDTPLDQNLESKNLADIIPNTIQTGESIDTKALCMTSSSSLHNDGSDIIQSFIDQDKVVEAIILDNIANGDCFKNTKENTVQIDVETGKRNKQIKYINTFKPYMLVRCLNELSSTYYSYFINKYSVKPEIAKVALSSIQSSTNTNLYKFINKTLSTARYSLAEGR